QSAPQKPSQSAPQKPSQSAPQKPSQSTSQKPSQSTSQAPRQGKHTPHPSPVGPTPLTTKIPAAAPQTPPQAPPPAPAAQGGGTPRTGAAPAGPALLEGRYEVLDVIKSGAMGCVYRARDTRLGTIVAIKQLLPIFGSADEVAYGEERFREEARLLSQLHHSGLPKVIDYFSIHDPSRFAGAHHLVMTYVDGADLETVMASGNKNSLEVEEVLDHTCQILEILIYLHSQAPPVIYRDLKPSNIMVAGGRVYLVDFGIARVFMPARKGTAIGTSGYAAPEQYKGAAEPRSDLYGLGAVMHYLLTGSDPQDMGSTIFSFEAPRKSNPKVPGWLNKLVLSLLEMSPDKRPPSAEKVLEMIQAKQRLSGIARKIIDISRIKIT
ncbi:MAG: protein kinase, partial [Candidatus Eremiobacteraeota bacterium]|nr:protein kinase [Candidatus Eremiobacteraeota bacterium]